MSYLIEEKQKFDKERIGSFGDFETNSSYELNYLMSTLDISDINDLNSASDILSFDDTNFEELVQRDIDYGRVDKQIVKNYLEQGKDKAVFFPPILVTPMVVKEGKPLEKFKQKKIKTSEDSSKVSINWDDQMELNFPIYSNADENYPYKIKDEKGDSVCIHNYATTLKYKSKSVKLVVIDGQHRFMALKRIWDDTNKRDLIKNIKIPLCIFFTPNATEDNISNNTLTKSMRQLFVTINSTAKQVSGHFIVLLSDDSLSSYAVRDIANYWKKTKKLFFLEWNEREDKRASQINRKYSITTVKILDTVLKEKLFKKGRTKEILLLDNIEKSFLCELEELDCIDLNDISDDNFSLQILEQIKIQINKLITPCIDLLFFTPRPYKERKECFDNELKNLDKIVSDNIAGAKYFRDSILFQFREASNYDNQASKEIEKDFISKFILKPEDEFYFKNVFQQSYVTAWIEVYLDNNLKKYMTLEEYTRKFISSMQIICFDFNKQLFGYSKEYTQNIFYKNSRILVNTMAKKELSSLIISTFLNTNVINEITLGQANKYEIEDNIKKYANKKIQDYFDSYKKNTIADIKGNWKTVLDPESDLYSKLITLEREFSTKEGKEKFELELSKYVDKKYEKAKKIFCNVIEIDEDNTF